QTAIPDPLPDSQAPMRALHARVADYYAQANPAIAGEMAAADTPRDRAAVVQGVVTAAQANLDRLAAIQDAAERYAQQNPHRAAAMDALILTAGQLVHAYGYVRAGALGAVRGAPLGPWGAVGGAVVGMAGFHVVNEAAAAGIGASIDYAVEQAEAQGDTPEQADRNGRAVRWAAEQADTLLVLKGAAGLAARKLAVPRRAAHTVPENSAGSGFYDPRAMERMLQDRYGADAVTAHTMPRANQPNVKLTGRGRDLADGVHIPFDNRGFPIFDKYVKAEMRLPDSMFKAESKTQMRHATRSLRDSIDRGEINTNIFNQEQLAVIRKGLDKIPGHTWHHHQEAGRMQLVPEKIHNALAHVGGDFLWGQ
ncbi:MAG: HNH endonuclease, partial [Alphaproteobacteria bacterium]